MSHNDNFETLYSSQPFLKRTGSLADIHSTQVCTLQSKVKCPFSFIAVKTVPADN